MSYTVAFLGLGVMGYPSAGYLADAGYDLRVYNRTESKAQEWAKTYKGVVCETPADAAAGADLIFSCVGNDDDLRSVTLGDNGAFSTIESGSIYIDLTTVSAKIARELANIAVEKEFSFLDAPVSGGQIGAENGQLSVMVGGDESAFERAKPVIEVFSKSVLLLGPSGAGQLTKMVNQICIAGVVQGLAEGINFAECAGLDPTKVIAAISKGAAQSWQMENRYESMAQNEYNFGFAVDWMRKDLRIALEEARNNGASLSVAALVDQYYSDVQNMGGGRWDTSSLLARLKKMGN